MKKRFLLLMGLMTLWAGYGFGQTVLWAENFNAGSAAWDLTGNGATLIGGSSPATNGTQAGNWIVNNVGTTIDGTNNLHVTCTSFICNLLGAPGPLYNAGGATTFTNRVAFLNNDIPASTFSGPGPFTLEFEWICMGGVFDAGDGAARLVYSVNSGTTWSEVPFDYIGNASVQQESIIINAANFPGFIPGTTPLRIGFRWFYFQSGGGVPTDPPMIVDNIEILGPSSSNTITTNAPSPAGPYCAGASISVPFTSTGTFNVGNTYTVQLSDATGSFASPVNIGSLSSTANSGTITATIPAGAASGTGYLIRVISSNPGATGTNFGPFTINATVVPSATITANPGTTICAGTSVTFTVNPVNGGSTPTYQWQVNSGSIGGATSSTFTSSTLSNGDDIAVILTSNAACAIPTSISSNILTMTVTPSVTPSVSITSNPGTTICAGTLVTFTANPVNGGSPTYQWQVNGSNIGGATSSTFSSSTLSNGDVVSVVMGSSLSCAVPASVSSNTLNMTVNPAVVPSVSVSVNPGTTICAGDAVSFTANPVNGGTPTYQWQVNGSNIGGATNATFSSSTLSNGDVVTVVMTSTANCANPSTATSAGQTMIVNPVIIPSVSISANPGTSVCAGTSITFTASAVNGGSPSFQWQINGVNVGGATGLTFSSSTLSNGDVVTVTMTSTAACAQPAVVSSNALNISVVSALVPSVTVSANPSSPVCAGTSITFSAAAVNGGTSPGYQWQVNGVNVGGATSATFSSSTLNDGDQVTVLMTSNDPCASPSSAASAPVAVSVVSSLVPSVSVSLTQNLPVCAGTVLDFSATAVNGGTSPGYQWQVNGVNVAGAINATFSSGTLNDGDVVSVVMSSSDPCANPTVATSNVITVVLSNNLIASVSINASTDTVCAGVLPTFTALAVNGGTSPSFQWTINGVNVGGAVSSSFNPASINNGDLVGVTLVSNDPCVSSPTVNAVPVTITVVSSLTPSVSITASTDTICPGDPVVFSTSINNGGSNPTFQWFQNGNPISGQTGASLNSPAGVSLSNNDVITVVMTSSDACASPVTASSNAITMTVSATAITPGITISVNNQTICAGDLASFSSVVTNGGTAPQIQWQVNGVNAPGGTGSLFSSLTIANGDVITATVISNAVCASTAPVSSNAITMTVNPQVTPTVTVIATPSSICQGQSVTYSISSSGGGSSPTFQWLLNGLALPGQTGSTYTNNAITGADQVAVQMLSNELCTTVNPVTSAGVTVSVLPPLTPSVSLSVNDSTLCGNDAPVFNASFVNGGTNPLFNWFVDGVLSATSSLPSFIPNGLSSGQVVSVQLVSSYLCASPVNVLSSGISVTFTPNPVVNAGADVRVLLGNSVQLNATNDTGWVYFWSPAAGLSCTSCSNPVATPTATTTYAIEVTDQASGCTGSDTIVVEVYEQTDVFIPTAFSPNKDGANDVLFVRGNGIRDFELVIYNRNGEAVFRTSSQAEGWDGTYKGQDLDSGVFHYVLTGTFSSGESISQSGNVSICR